MESIRSRRLLAAVALTAAAVAPIAPAPVAADVAVTDADVVDAAAAYLTGQLVDGDHLEGDFGPQYGPTADVAFALHAAASQPDALDAVVAYMTTADTVRSYTQGGDFDGNDVENPAYVGATAKLGLLVTVSGLDPRDVAGTDLVGQLESLEQESGRYADRSDYGDFANLFGQSFALLFLTDAADVAPPPAAVEALLAAQCDDGGFPQDWDEDACTGQPDATALAVQALLATADLADVDTAVADAAAWLQAAQDDGGAWGDPRNVNSTGYAGMGLRSVEADAGVAAAQDFLAAVRNDDGGLPVNPDGDSDPFATAQALPLLASESFLLFVTGPGVPTPDGVERVAGGDRIATAIAVSAETYPGGDASTVVLARSDDFADALAGTPVAAAADGPLLLTATASLDDRVLDEIDRVLDPGDTVHLLGGEAALSPDVADALTDAGYTVVRLGGDTRFDTSVVIAEFLDDPALLVTTTGLDFPDALAAGTAAAARGGAVLLTAGDDPHPSVTAYLEGRQEAELVAVGGPAATAYPSAVDVVGATRDATAVAVAEYFFEDPDYVGVARNDVFADALSGAVQIARVGGPLLLTAPDTVPAVTQEHLCTVGPGVYGAVVWGGEAAVGDATVATITDRLAGSGC